MVLDPDISKLFPDSSLMISGGNTYQIGKFLDPEIEKQLQIVKRITIPGSKHDVCSELPEKCTKEISEFLTKQ